MADEHKAEVPEDPDGERVGNLSLEDLDQGPAPDEDKDLVADVGEQGTPVPTAPEEAPEHTESQ